MTVPFPMPATHGRTGPTRRGSHRAEARRVVGGLTLVLATLAPSCGDPGSADGWREDFTIPAELRGRWVASSERYAGRALELGAEEVVFDRGREFGFSANRIREGRREATAQGTLYEIRYATSPGSEVFTLSFFHRPGDGGEIRFANQPEVTWTPAGDEGG